MVKVTRKQWGLVLYSIAVLVMSFVVWFGAKDIFNRSYATIIKILTGTICFIWSGAIIIAGYIVWRIKKDIY